GVIGRVAIGPQEKGAAVRQQERWSKLIDDLGARERGWQRAGVHPLVVLGDVALRPEGTKNVVAQNAVIGQLEPGFLIAAVVVEFGGGCGPAIRHGIVNVGLGTG